MNRPILQKKNSSLNETQSPEPEPLKQIEWKDGKTYSYNYTETITTKDSLGNEKEITVYKREKPKESDIICDKKICKWCSLFIIETKRREYALSFLGDKLQIKQLLEK